MRPGENIWSQRKREEICNKEERKCQEKNARKINMKFATEVYDQLERFCCETSMSKTVATEKIMPQFFDE